jgi:hypothetical protein
MDKKDSINQIMHDIDLVRSCYKNMRVNSVRRVFRWNFRDFDKLVRTLGTPVPSDFRYVPFRGRTYTVEVGCDVAYVCRMS